MRHTLHEQHRTFATNKEFGDLLQNELGFTADGDNYFIGESGLEPYIKAPETINACVYFYNGSIAVNSITKVSSSESDFYFHISSDLSVRHMSVRSVSSVVWAQDVNGEWSCISLNNFISSGSTVAVKNIYTQNNNYTIDINGLYTLTKIARTDNGVPFKGLYMVTSARSYFERDTLVNVNGDIFRLVSLGISSGNYPALAFKVSGE